MIIISEWSRYVPILGIKEWFDHNNRMITLSVITLSGFHCIMFSPIECRIMVAGQCLEKSTSWSPEETRTWSRMESTLELNRFDFES
jgi:hypothetical protein